MCHFLNSIINILYSKQQTAMMSVHTLHSIHVKFDLFVGSIFITVYWIKVILCVSFLALSLFLSSRSPSFPTLNRTNTLFALVYYLFSYLPYFIYIVSQWLWYNILDIFFLFIQFHEEFISANVRFDEMFSRLRI